MAQWKCRHGQHKNRWLMERSLIPLLPRRALALMFALPLGFLCQLPNGSDAQAQELAHVPQALSGHRVAVATTPVVFTQHTARLALTGSVAARNLINLSFRAGGQVIERLADIGQRVEAGDLLARIDAVDQQAALASAQANLDAAQAQLKQASANYERQKVLLQQGFTTRSQFGTAQEGKQRAESMLSAAQSQMSNARDMMAYTQLRAPRAGIVTMRNIETGQLVQAAQTAYVIAADGERDAVFDVQEALAAQAARQSPDLTLQQTPKLTLSLISDPSVTTTGHVREVAPVVNPATGTVRVKVGLDQTPEHMTLGAAVTGNLLLPPVTAVELPWSVLTSDGGKPAVWLVDMDTSRTLIAPVEILSFESGKVLITSGLQQGQMVVTDGAQMLAQGIQVDVLEPSAPEPESSRKTLPKAPVSAEQQSEGISGEKPVRRPVLYLRAAAQKIEPAGFTGSVEPRYSTDLAFRMLGRIVQRDVNVGDQVTKGQVVAMIDPSALDLNVQAAEADFASAKAKYSNALASEQRQQQLLAMRSVPQALYDSARQARDTAAAELEKSRAELQKARDERGYAQLQPDFSGVVSQVNAEVGQVVAAGQTVLTVAQPDIREAVIDMPDTQAENVQSGDEFRVILQADPQTSTLGKVREVAPQADSATRLRRVRITLDNPVSTFRLGTTITAQRSNQKAQSQIILPVSALLEENGQSFIWLIDPQKLTVSRQKAGIVSRDTQTFIADGIAAGSLVVTAGVHTLRDGQQVKLAQQGND